MTAMSLCSTATCLPQFAAMYRVWRSVENWEFLFKNCSSGVLSEGGAIPVFVCC